MLKNISRKAKSLLHDGPLSSEVEMKYVSDNRQKMMEIIQGQNETIRISRTQSPADDLNRISNRISGREAFKTGSFTDYFQNNRPRPLYNR